MEKENYELLLEQNKNLTKEIEALKARVDDVCKMNQALLTTKEPAGSDENKETRQAELGKRLKEGLRNG